MKPDFIGDIGNLSHSNESYDIKIILGSKRKDY